MDWIKKLALRNLTLTILLILFGLMLIIHPVAPAHLFGYIDLKTILSLTGLLMITKGFQLSNFFENLAQSWIKVIQSERQLAALLILLTSIISPILTNDVALFIMIPLTLSFQRFLKNDLDKIIIFQILAANTGSSLTPIGNPQNLYIWHRWDIPFLKYTAHMIPVFIVTTGLLLLMTFSFPPRRLMLRDTHPPSTSLPLLLISSILLMLFIVAMEKDWIRQGVLLIFLIYLFVKREANQSRLGYSAHNLPHVHRLQYPCRYSPFTKPPGKPAHEHLWKCDTDIRPAFSGYKQCTRHNSALRFHP